MPDLLERSLEDMLAAMASTFGTSWPNPWWPTGNSGYDDCAADVSYFLFGLNSARNPFYSYVSQLQNYFAAQGRRTWGNAGIQRGDVLAFSWTKDRNSFDHTEIALGPVSPAGLITSRGTNSNPGDDQRDRTRSASYVVSYSRPAYPGTSAAGLDFTPIIDQIAQEDDMPLTDADIGKILNFPAYDGGPTVSAALKGLVGRVSSIGDKVEQNVIRDGKPVPQIQDNADTNTMVRNLTAQVGALQQALSAIATSQGVDPAAITKAAQAGAEAALRGITLKAVTQ